MELNDWLNVSKQLNQIGQGFQAQQALGLEKDRLKMQQETNALNRQNVERGWNKSNRQQKIEQDRGKAFNLISKGQEIDPSGIDPEALRLASIDAAEMKNRNALADINTQNVLISKANAKSAKYMQGLSAAGALLQSGNTQGATQEAINAYNEAYPGHNVRQDQNTGKFIITSPDGEESPAPFEDVTEFIRAGMAHGTAEEFGKFLVGSGLGAGKFNAKNARDGGVPVFKNGKLFGYATPQLDKNLNLKTVYTRGRFGPDAEEIIDPAELRGLTDEKGLKFHEHSVDRAHDKTAAVYKAIDAYQKSGESNDPLSSQVSNPKFNQQDRQTMGDIAAVLLPMYGDSAPEDIISSIAKKMDEAQMAAESEWNKISQGQNPKKILAEMGLPENKEEYIQAIKTQKLYGALQSMESAVQEESQNQQQNAGADDAFKEDLINGGNQQSQQSPALGGGGRDRMDVSNRVPVNRQQTGAIAQDSQPKIQNPSVDKDGVIWGTINGQTQRIAVKPSEKIYNNQYPNPEYQKYLEMLNRLGLSQQNQAPVQKPAIGTNGSREIF